MKTSILFALAVLMLVAVPLHADSGGQPNLHSKKKRSQQVASSQQRADEVRIIAIGGYRQENLWEAGERWRANKAQAHRDDKSRRDRDAQERLSREGARREAVAAKNDHEKLVGEQRRAAEQSRKAAAQAPTKSRDGALVAEARRRENEVRLVKNNSEVIRK